MTKKRVFELAKEYGLKGADLAKKLKDLGFDKVRNQMSALDEFELLQVQARLELAGLIPESLAPTEAPETKGIAFKRKPKKAVPAAAPEPAPVEHAPAPAPPHHAPEAEQPVHVTEVIEEEPVTATTEVEAPAETVEAPHAHPAPAHEAHHGKAPAPHTEHAHTHAHDGHAATIEEPAETLIKEEDATESVEESTAPAVEESATASSEEAAPESPETAVEETVATAPEEVAAAEVAESAVADAAIEAPPAAPAQRESVVAHPVKPSHSEPRPTRGPSRPAARIVGRIDPALLKPQKPTQTARPAAQQQQQSNQGQGGDQPAAAQGGISVSGSDADVRPTLKHNRSRALTRSDVSQSRDRLTAAQMREKEQQRVRRLTGPQKGGLGTIAQRTAPGGAPGSGSAPAGSAASREKISRRSQIILNPPVTIRSLSEALGLKVNDLVRTMFMTFKRMATPNTTLVEEDAKLLALEHGFEIEIRAAVTAEEEIRAERSKVDAEDAEFLVPRAPVIAFLGHVDHGKTSLIDAIRETNVAGGEAGGITQHIGAYRVTTRSGRPITILDTPGHQAFTEMRKRGAQATDMVILVVAADDGVMPQTEEAYAHAKAAGVPVIVALNKSDKATEQQKEKTISQLATLGLAPESWHGVSWGGSTAVIETSATKRTGIDDLLERVALEAEVLDLKANPQRNPEGIVIEAQKSGQRGIVATLLVQKGTLRPGDIILAGAGYGRVRNLYNDRGQALDAGGPSLPVEVTGLSELPSAGDHFVIVDELSQAQEAALERARKMRERERAGQSREVTLSSLFSKIKEGQAKEVKIVLKADVGGSLEVLKKQLDSIAAKDPQGNEIHVKVIYAAVGAISEADVNLAASSSGVVIGFHVLASDAVKKLGQREGVEVRVYQILYELIEDVKKFMEGLVAPVQREVVVGHADVRATFRSSKFGTIAGCMVSDGFVNRSTSVRVIRNGGVVYTGRIDSLRRLKDDVREVKAGFECGIKVSGYDDIKDGDVLEFFEIKEEKPTLISV